MKTILPFIEIGFAAYFNYFLINEIRFGNWFAVPFLVLFAGGFTYVAICSIGQWFPGLRAPWKSSNAVSA
jgi:hypothetical protein